MTHLLALLLSLSLVLPASAAQLAGSAGKGGGAGGGAAGAAVRPAFLRALNLHLDLAGLRLGASLPGSNRLALEPGRAAAEYLSRAALAPAAPVSGETAPVSAEAARVLGGVLAEPAARAEAAALLRAAGGAEGAGAAARLEALGKRVEGLAPLVRLGRDLRAGPVGAETERRLAEIFAGEKPAGAAEPEAVGEDAGSERAPRAASGWGGSLASPELFADYAARRFHAGLVESATRAPVVRRDPTPSGWRARAAARFPRLLGWLAPRAVPDDGTLSGRMELSPLTNAERERAIIDIFRQGGAAESDIRLQDIGRGQHNVIVTKPGRTSRVIVVGGHFDKVQRGRGTIDNWTGATMVANLYQALRGVETEATIVFIAFGREEEGLIGSREYVRSLPSAERGRIDAMINLDTLAVDGTFSWKNNSDQALLDAIRQTATEGAFELQELRLSGGDSDSSSFRRAGMLAMTVLGASNEVIWDIIHSENDTMKWFSLPHYKNAYLLTLALLRRLDRQPPPRRLGPLPALAWRLSARFLG